MKQKDILFLIIPFFALVLIYLIFSVYHNSVTSTISENLNIQITPIAPDFDQKAIAEIKKRNVIVPSYEVTPEASISAKKL